MLIEKYLSWEGFRQINCERHHDMCDAQDFYGMSFDMEVDGEIEY